MVANINSTYFLGKRNKERSLSAPSIAELRKRFGFEDVLWVQNALWMVIQHKWQDDPKDHAKLVSYNKDSERGATVY